VVGAWPNLFNFPVIITDGRATCKKVEAGPQLAASVESAFRHLRIERLSLLDAARIIADRKAGFYRRKSTMPIYEFRCKKCGHQIEVFQKLSDKPPTRCQKCGGRLEKLISPTAFQFKGEGWYVTDYARKGSVADKVEKELSAPESAGGSEKEKPKTPPAKKTSSDKS